MADMTRGSAPGLRFDPARLTAQERAVPAIGRGMARLAKRALDVTASAVGLVLLSPVLLVVAIAVRVDSSGPAIFAQRRLGKNGRPFTFYKFRSMCDGCDSDMHRSYVSRLIKSQSEELKGASGSYKLDRDPRITRVGRILRRTSLDELPQLYNVLRGEMSLVGPRPPLAYEVELYTARHMRRLEATPGMSGLWQVSGRTNTTFEQMVDLDLAYIDNWSLALDLEILLRTISVVLDRGGAW